MQSTKKWYSMWNYRFYTIIIGSSLLTNKFHNVKHTSGKRDDITYQWGIRVKGATKCSSIFTSNSYIIIALRVFSVT